MLVEKINKQKVEGELLLNSLKEYYVKMDIEVIDVDFVEGFTMEVIGEVLPHYEMFFRKKVKPYVIPNSNRISEIESDGLSWDYFM